MQVNGNSPTGNKSINALLLNTAGALEKLSSAQRINRAGDDAAGLTISEKMRSQIRGYNMASRNTSDSISMIQTADGALAETQSMLQRMRELAVQAANDTYTDSDRLELQAEVGQLKKEITRVGNSTEFNTIKLLDGSAQDTSAGKTENTEVANTVNADGSLLSQIGANSGQTAFVSIGDMRATALNIDDINISTRSGAAAALEAIDSAMEAVSSQRGTIGAMQNRFEYTASNLNSSAENLQAAESRIRDADMAKLAVEQTKNSILLQFSLAMQAQANMKPQNVMRL